MARQSSMSLNPADAVAAADVGHRKELAQRHRRLFPAQLKAVSLICELTFLFCCYLLLTAVFLSLVSSSMPMGAAS